jgi:hypothetical protein
MEKVKNAKWQDKEKEKRRSETVRRFDGWAVRRNLRLIYGRVETILATKTQWKDYQVTRLSGGRQPGHQVIRSSGIPVSCYPPHW